VLSYHFILQSCDTRKITVISDNLNLILEINRQSSCIKDCVILRSRWKPFHPYLLKFLNDFPKHRYIDLYKKLKCFRNTNSKNQRLSFLNIWRNNFFLLCRSNYQLQLYKYMWVKKPKAQHNFQTHTSLQLYKLSLEFLIIQ
jgi:hypothetical protein